MRFQCSQCGFAREIPDKFAGKVVKCPQCKARITIPAGAPPAPPPGAAPPPVPPAAAAPQESITRYSVDDFIRQTAQKEKGEGLFELENERMLEINLNGMVWTKMGSMVAYKGSIKFTREGAFEHGMGKFLKKAVTGEGAQLTKAEGRGALYLADGGKKISILNLQNDEICVNGNDLLAFEYGIQWDITMMKKIAGMLAGGLFNVKLQGRGMIAITTHHDPLTLVVSPQKPVITDPNATVAWSGNLAPELQTDISFKTFLGRGSGESIQMRFAGKGFVVIQPYEEVYMQSG
jgi:uncharacterized protein (AIM24 family)